MNEDLILTGLINNEDYLRKVIPFLKKDYFQQNESKVVYELIDNYTKKYNSLASKEALDVELDQTKNISEDQFKNIKSLIHNIFDKPKENTDWLIEKTERYCQDRAVYNAIMKSIQIIDGKNQQLTKNAIPEILQEALAVQFDGSIGHNYTKDSDERYESYHRKEKRVPFDLDYFNKITRGGLPRKTLNVVLAGTGVGKTMFMCHSAACNYLQGYNVLYITLEMGEIGDPSIAERIDSNLLNLSVDELKIIPKDVFDKKLDRVKQRTTGSLIIKEYPTAQANSQHFKNLIEELRIKRNFNPDIVYIDYLNICTSSRFKQVHGVNSYSYIKAIAEELRGLAVEYQLPIVTATQTTRSGFSNTDVGLEDTSESFGLPATADFMFALITSDELAGLNQVMVKQLKNRYSDPNQERRFVIGVDREKMRFYNTEQSAQSLMDDSPVMDKTEFMERDSESTFFNKKSKRKLNTGGFKI